MEIIQGILFHDLPHDGFLYGLSDVLLHQIDPPAKEGFIEVLFVGLDLLEELDRMVPELLVVISGGGGRFNIHINIIVEFDDLN